MQHSVPAALTDCTLKSGALAHGSQDEPGLANGTGPRVFWLTDQHSRGHEQKTDHVMPRPLLPRVPSTSPRHVLGWRVRKNRAHMSHRSWNFGK
jgi:hypothetical protein